MLTALLLVVTLGTAPTVSGAEPPAPAAPKGFTWVVPKVLEELPVPGESWARGIPVHLHVVRSREHPENILRDFAMAARKQGLYLPHPDALPRPEIETTITALDTGTFRSYTVILQPEPDGTVAVILSEADLSRRQPVSGEHFAPIPPGALNPLSTRLEGFETLSFDLPAQAGDPLSFYRSLLPKAGFTEVEPQVFRRGSEELAVQVLPPGQGRKEQGVVVTRRTAAPPTGDQLFKLGE